MSSLVYFPQLPGYYNKLEYIHSKLLFQKLNIPRIIKNKIAFEDLFKYSNLYYGDKMKSFDITKFDSAR